MLAEQIEWFEAGLDEPDAPERFHVEVPSNIRLSRIGPGETLSNLLEEGDLDALVGPAEPEFFSTSSPHFKAVSRLPTGRAGLLSTHTVFPHHAHGRGPQQSLPDPSLGCRIHLRGLFTGQDPGL